MTISNPGSDHWLEESDHKVMRNQIRRLMAECDLLLGAISSEDYAKIKDQMDKISESPDE